MTKEDRAAQHSTTRQHSATGHSTGERDTTERTLSDGETRHGHQSRHTPPNDNAGQLEPPADPQQKAATPDTNNTSHQKQHRRRAQHNERARQGTHSRRAAGREAAGQENKKKKRKKKGGRGGGKAKGNRKARKARDNRGGGKKNKKNEGRGWGSKTPRPRAPQAGKHAKQETTGHTGEGEGKKGGGGTRRQGPRHPGPENTQGRTQGGRNEGEKGRATRKEKKKTQQQPQTGQPQPGGGEQARSEARKAKGNVRRTKTRPGRRPARPGQAGHAHAQQPGSPPERAGSRGGESARPRTHHTQARGAPRGHPHAAPTGRKASSQERAVGLVTGLHARAPPHPQPVGSQLRQPTQRAGSRGWESARPRTPHTQAGGPPPPGTLMPPPQRAKPARKSGRCGFGDGPPARTPPHPQPVGSGPWQPAQRAGSRCWESARPRTPHTQAGGAPPRAPSCRPHSAQSQLERTPAVGLVTGPHARTPPHPQPVGSGPRQPAQRAGSRGWESARPRTPHTQAGGPPPPGTLVPPP